MALPIILIGLFSLNKIFCHDSDSLEVNRIDFTPFYDMVIFSDVADIINEFDNNANSPLDALVNSESESGEDIEDLLLEYQRYLEKAHKQRRGYLENKTKNKVPMLRRDKYVRPNPVISNNYQPNTIKIAQTPFNNPLDFFIPFNNKVKYMNTEFTTYAPHTGLEEMSNLKLVNSINGKKRLLDFQSNVRESTINPIKSSCFCKNNKIPCDCDCKQCLVPIDHMFQKNDHYRQQFYQDRILTPENVFFNDITSKKSKYSTEQLHDVTDNVLNIGIKVDIQLPKAQEYTEQFVNNSEKLLYRVDNNSKEYITSTINLPLPYFNIPIPMDLFGYRKTINKIHSTPLQKITIHKKKKSKATNNNKKHRKKVITFHNIKLEPQKSLSNIFEESFNFNDNYTKPSNLSQMIHYNTHNITTQKVELNNNIINQTNATSPQNKTVVEDTIYLMLNITNNSDNQTDDFHKNVNSIEIDYSKKSNLTTEKAIGLRKRRDIALQTGSTLATSYLNLPVVSVTIKNDTHKTSVQSVKSLKKNNKTFVTDSELLYWPNNPRNSVFTSKNITTIILEREHTKTKLNISRETIRNNHTRALEKAIFGDVDWNDVDTVAPVFMSFVGKYVKGILTFCSQSICHSMKCAEKTCRHRICVPEERWNQRGHCAGSNSTDSVASMESIMDLPSNVAFEIVDILEEKMLGKLFGKVTLCINMKCISFVASKKKFIKTKCLLKEINVLGHCPSKKVI